MLEITVDKFKELNNALDDYIKASEIINDSRQYNKFIASCLQSRWRKHWLRSYKHCKQHAILKIILTKYGTIKLIGDGNVVITGNPNILYYNVYGYINYKKMITCEHNLKLWE
jgi:hypothetical protein